MTVEEMTARVSSREFVQWRAFFKYRHDLQKEEMERGRHGS